MYVIPQWLLYLVAENIPRLDMDTYQSQQLALEDNEQHPTRIAENWALQRAATRSYHMLPTVKLMAKSSGSRS